MLDWLRKGQQTLQDREQPLTEHLGELRDRLLYSAIAVAVCAGLGFAYAREIIAFLVIPLKSATSGLPIEAQLHFTSITEPLFQSFKIALFAGIGLAFPFWVWQIWKFVAPGLYENERQLVTPFLLSSSTLFLIGTTFAYTIAVPLAYRFLLLYANPYQAQSKPSAGISFQLIPAAKPTALPKKTSPPKTPFRLTWTSKGDKGPKGWRFQITAKDKSFAWTPEGILRELAKNKRLEFHLRQGKTLHRYHLKYRWPSPTVDSPTGSLKPILTLQAYLSVSSWFLLGFGLIFQTPLLIILITSSGVISAELLGQYRRHAFVAILIIAAVLTPTGDPVNLMIMALPMYILFEIGLLISRRLEKRRRGDLTDSPPQDEYGLTHYDPDEYVPDHYDPDDFDPPDLQSIDEHSDEYVPDHYDPDDFHQEIVDEHREEHSSDDLEPHEELTAPDEQPEEPAESNDADESSEDREDDESSKGDEDDEAREGQEIVDEAPPQEPLPDEDPEDPDSESPPVGKKASDDDGTAS